MSDRQQITVRVSPEQAQNWSDYSDELGYKHRTEMIRRAVEYYYATETGSANNDIDVEIRSSIEDLEQKLDMLRVDVSDVREEQLSREEIDDIAQEMAYTLEHEHEHDVWDEDDFQESLYKFGIYDADEQEIHKAQEQFLSGFTAAIYALDEGEHGDARRVLMNAFVDQMQEMDFGDLPSNKEEIVWVSGSPMPRDKANEHYDEEHITEF